MEERIAHTEKYQILMEMNRRIVFGEEIPDTEKEEAVSVYLPKTNMLYANHYELEILRLLYLFIPDDQKVNEMVKNTLQRVKGKCFSLSETDKRQFNRAYLCHTC